ncbi:Component of a membrane-bound complex containing the Tor2p kinase [Dimargaris cristalligena]|nr:Component of a membrane-bound complex containing the Tor2p kinase [Dimargaris cristalligena]
MSLVSDPDYLIHQLRIQFLRSEDRIGDRIITFPSVEKLMENPYIQANGPYPELQYSISPDIQFQGDYYFGDRTPGLSSASGGTNHNSSTATPTTSSRNAPAPPSGLRHRAATDGQIQATRENGKPPRHPHPSTGSKAAISWSKSRTSASSVASLTEGPNRTSKRTSPNTSGYPAEDSVPPVPPLPLAINPLIPHPGALNQGADGGGGVDPNNTSNMLSNLSMESDDSIDLEADVGSAQVPQGFTSPLPLTSPTKLIDGEPDSQRVSPMASPPSRSPRLEGVGSSSSLDLVPQSPPPIQPRDSLDVARQRDSPTHPPPTAPPSPEPEFQRCPLSVYDDSAASGLSLLLVEKKESKNNPLAARYRALGGQGDVNPLALDMFIPHASEPQTPLQIVVKRNTTVEDVIGFSLFEYIERGWSPELTEAQASIGGWNIRMVEDDGEIDEDFPVLDRTRQISKFGASQFALCATAVAQPPARPEPIRTPVRGGPPARDSPRRIQPGAAFPLRAPPTEAPLPKRLVKIHIHSTVEALRTTTMSLVPTHTLYETLVRICDKWQIDRDQYILTTADTKVPLDLNMTLRDLPRVAELYLYRQGATLSIYGNENMRPFSIFLDSQPPESRNAGPPKNPTISERFAAGPKTTSAPPLPPPTPVTMEGGEILPLTPPVAFPPSLGRTPPPPTPEPQVPLAPTTTGLVPFSPHHNEGGGPPRTSGNRTQSQPIYRQYTVVRRTPMFTGHERSLIIDEDYIHLSPSEQKHMFDSMKTSVHHISAVKSCNINRKLPRKFKLMIIRDHGNKSYDLEAATPEEAQEICNIINHILRRFKSDL